MENILELQQVSKTFPKSDFTLDQVTFSLPYGSILGFVGENGAGKTTTMGCILNTVRKDSGTVKLFGREMTDADTDIREKIGVVYDGDNFPSYWTAKQLSQVMEKIYARWDQALFRKYLEDFHLPSGQKIKHYSRGMAMKLAIAAALSHHPQLLILDEATSGLDPVMRDEMLEVFLDFVQDENHSILLSSHITSDLERVADYITFIHKGKLVMTVSKNDLVYHYAVLRCRESQFLALDPADIIAFRKRDFQIDVLVSDGKKMQRKYKDMVVDHVSVDEIMVLLVKGGTGMKGLLKNNFSAVWANAKIFSVFMFLLGVFAVAVISQSLLIGYAMIGMVGFSANAIAVAKNEFASKWGKYKLVLPVKRADIIKSLFLNQILWLLMGTLFAAAGVLLSWLFHGCPFDQPVDILSMFALGISISLFMGAIFFPLFYLGGAERSEVFLIISLLCATAADFVIVSISNDLMRPGITAVLLGGAALLVFSLLAFSLSCPLTVAIFKRKEY